MKNWAAFYVDDHMEIRYVDDETHRPEDVPGDGIVGVAVQDDRSGWYMDSSKDFYAYDETLLGGWCGLDFFGLTRLIVQSVGRPIVLKLGTNIPMRLWDEFAQNCADKMPPKSAYRPGEIR